MENQNNQLSWIDARGVTHEGVVCQVVDGFSVVDCEYCGFKHVVPLPTAGAPIALDKVVHFLENHPELSWPL